jgi:transglutaminase-like putative cysteine protease
LVSSIGVEPLALTVGCTFGFETPQAISAVLQVAPTRDDQVVLSERWETDADHHGYADSFGNRCERIRIDAGTSRIVYEAEVSLSSPNDRIALGTRETPIMDLADEHLTYVMPSRFCLPDELGHEAWLRFGDIAPGWDRVQAIVDYVHNRLQWVAGASNPWTTAADAFSRGKVCAAISLI